MVGRRDHDHGRDRRIDQADHPPAAAPHERHRQQRRPHRPGQVQRGHRRELVRLDAAVVRALETGDHVGVHEPGARQQPRRHHRVEHEHRHAHQVRDHQRVPGPPVEPGGTDVTPDQHAHGHRDVGVLVPVGGDRLERLVRGQQVVEPRLDVDVQQLLEVEDILAVQPRRKASRRREGPDVVVHLDQHQHDDQLADQMRPLAAALAPPGRRRLPGLLSGVLGRARQRGADGSARRS